MAASPAQTGKYSAAEGDRGYCEFASQMSPHGRSKPALLGGKFLCIHKIRHVPQTDGQQFRVREVGFRVWVSSLVNV